MKSKAGKKTAPRTRRPVVELTGPVIAFEVAVCESNRVSQERARALLSELGYQVAPEEDEAAIVGRLHDAPPRAVLAGLPERAGLIKECLATELERPVVIAALVAPS